MGFTIIKDTAAGENFYRAGLILNLTLPNPHGPGGIPFISVGARDDRGNGSPVGALNPSSSSGIPHRVIFTAKLYDFLAPSQGGAIFGMWVVAEWGGIPRMLFLNLFHWGIETNGIGRTWNWPVAEHYLYPGANVAYIDAEDVYSQCGFSVSRMELIGQQITYNIDLQSLYQCASNNGWFRNPLPANQQDIPIKGVHWYNEATGSNGWIFTSVHGMQMQ